MICCVLPAYKATATVCDVVAAALDHCHLVVVVDDCCPDSSADSVEAAFATDPRVVIIRRGQNGGVGAAVKTGLSAALDRGASVVVKIDADGQMNPAYIPLLAAAIEDDPAIAYAKGNRFFDPSVLRRMPRVRLIGNALLSLLVKFASGYWNIVDPTNGYVAFNCDVLRTLSADSFADSYYFEISVLNALGLQRYPIAEIEMETIYGNERSSLAIRRVLMEFPPRLVKALARRVAFQYFLADVNLGTLYLVLGFVMTLVGLSFGIYQYVQTWLTGVARTPGTVMLAIVPILIGAQLTMNALMYDVQFAPRTTRLLARLRKR